MELVTADVRDAVVPEAAWVPYDGPTFTRVWWRQMAQKVGAAPFQAHFVQYQKPLLKPFLELRLLGLPGFNVAWGQQLTPEAAEALHQLLGKPGWDYFRMTWLETEQQTQVLESFGEAAIQVPLSPSFAIHLPDGLAPYLAALGRPSRHNLRRKQKAAQCHQPRLVVFQTPSEREAFWTQYFACHQAYWQDKPGGSYLADPREQAFLLDWTEALAAQNQLQLVGLMLGDDWVNLRMNILAGDTCYTWMTINTGEFADLSPGILGLFAVIDEGLTSGITTFHLGPGEYRYKQQYANIQIPRTEMLLANPASLRGKLYTDWLRRRLATF